ncbi:MAG: tetratricopeptide repeat protein [Acidobacteria bacterium]|nr:tetratricopeptide repeat protein [Acidobacteriota bacterium]
MRVTLTREWNLARVIWRQAACLVVICVLGGVAGSPVRAQKAEDLLFDAITARREGRYRDGIGLLNLAVKKAPGNSTIYFVRGTIYELEGEFEKALADLNETVTISPEVYEAYQQRGMIQFKLGNFKESVADFDKVIEMEPSVLPQHWQRGISQYYAGLYEEGRKQFEEHQKLNSHDVENGVWHFLCVARARGVKEARAAMLDITGDSRVPMKQIYDFFRGQGSVEDVMRAAREAEPVRDTKSNQLFNANLYVGLYHEATGDKAAARKYITAAAQEYPQKHYMWEVARVHSELFSK